MLVLHDGSKVWTGGFDTTQSLLRSIRTEWNRAHGPSDDMVDNGITVSLFRPTAGQPDVLALINPASISLVIDLRDGVT
jgi:hypothetical protein